MNKEEAIKTIEVIKCEAEWEYPLNWQLALDMAIEALKKVDDIISHAEVDKSAHCEHCDQQETTMIFKDCRKYYNDKYTSVEVLSTAPSADKPTREWVKNYLKKYCGMWNR